MTWMWMLWTALAVDPPAELDLDNVDPYMDNSDKLLEGPTGCWELVGSVSWSWEFGRFGSTKGDAVMVGRFEDGKWTSIRGLPKGEQIRRGKEIAKTVYNADNRFVPLIGKIEYSAEEIAEVEAGAPSESQTVNLLEEMVEELTTEVSSSYLKWDDGPGQLVLVTEHDLEKSKGEAQTLVRFAADSTLPIQLDIVGPESFPVRRIPPIRLDNVRVRLRGTPHGQTVVPTYETFSFEARVLGIRGHGKQTIDYVQASRCTP